MAVGTYGYAADRWPAWVTVVLHALSIYGGFTVLRESVYRLSHRNRRVNDLIGWLPGLPLTVTLPTFRYVHLAHHAKTNEPDEDPDFVVGHGSWWYRPFTFLSPMWEYRVHYHGRRGWKSGAELVLDTRAYPSPVLNVLLLGQNYHLVHHAWVAVPWFRYQPVFEAARADLEAVGAGTSWGAWRRPLPAPPVASAG